LGRTLIPGNRGCPIKQFKQIFNELLRYRTQRQKQGDNDGSVQKESPGRLRSCLVADIKVNSAEPNLVFGSNAHGTVDPSPFTNVPLVGPRSRISKTPDRPIAWACCRENGRFIDDEFIAGIASDGYPRRPESVFTLVPVGTD
jgi:hypothetical protein